MSKPKKTEPEPNSFQKGKLIYKQTQGHFEDYLNAALFAAAHDQISALEVKEKIKTMITNHVLTELGYG